MLITHEFGSMVWLGTVLCAKEFEADELKEPVCNNCNLCVEVCPIHALDNREMNQKICWDYAFGEDEKTKSWRISCHKCRDICPHNLGSENKILVTR